MHTIRWLPSLASLVLVGSIALILPAPASARSAIAGQVTDGQVRYTIEALRPGSYRVTFTMQGFSRVVRDGIELVSNFTAPVSVQMKVGAVEETITVTGKSPLVDVQRTSSQQVLTREVLDALPTGDF